MSQRNEDRPQLARDEAAFVRRVAEAYAPPEPSPEQRVVFHAVLEERLAGESRRGLLPVLAGVAAVGAIALLAVTVTRSWAPRNESPALARSEAPVLPEAPDAPRAPGGGTAPVTIAPEAVLLALSPQETSVAAGGSEPEVSEEALPEDYVAIASLFFGG